MATDGYIVTNGEGEVFSNEDGVGVFNTGKEVGEALILAEGDQRKPAVYALVPIPAELVGYYVDCRTNRGMTRAQFLQDVALRFIGVLPWPSGKGKSAEETAESLVDLAFEHDDDPTAV